MLKYELTKSIEGRKVNRRTGNLMQGYPVTIPYGSLLVNVEYAEDIVRFDYLDNRFECPSVVVKGFLHEVVKPTVEMPDAAEPPAVAETMSASAGETPATAARPVDAPVPEPASGPALVFEVIPIRGLRVGMGRAKVPGGWLVATTSGGVTFLPDAEHTWQFPG